MRTGDTSSRGPLLCQEGTDCACSWYTWSALQKWLRGQLSALGWEEGKGHHPRREAPLELGRERGMSLHLPHTTRAPHTQAGAAGAEVSFALLPRLPPNPGIARTSGSTLRDVGDRPPDPDGTASPVGRGREGKAQVINCLSRDAPVPPDHNQAGVQTRQPGAHAPSAQAAESPLGRLSLLTHSSGTTTFLSVPPTPG